jgi:hypothetical protein
VAFVPHVLDIPGSYAFLIIHQPLARRMGFPEQIGDQGMHPRGGEQNGGVVFQE